MTKRYSNGKVVEIKCWVCGKTLIDNKKFLDKINKVILIKEQKKKLRIEKRKKSEEIVKEDFFDYLTDIILLILNETRNFSLS